MSVYYAGRRSAEEDTRDDAMRRATAAARAVQPASAAPLVDRGNREVAPLTDDQQGRASALNPRSAPATVDPGRQQGTPTLTAPAPPPPPQQTDPRAAGAMTEQERWAASLPGASRAEQGSDGNWYSAGGERIDNIEGWEPARRQAHLEGWDYESARPVEEQGTGVTAEQARANVQASLPAAQRGLVMGTPAADRAAAVPALTPEQAAAVAARQQQEARARAAVAAFQGYNPATAQPTATTQFTAADNLRGTQVLPAQADLSRVLAAVNALRSSGGAQIAPVAADLSRVRQATDALGNVTYAPSAEAQRARQLTAGGLESLYSAPDRMQILNDQLRLYDEQSAPILDQRLRSVVNAAAAAGRTRSGMTTNELTDVGTQWKRDRDQFGRGLISEAQSRILEDRLARLSASQGVAGQFRGEDIADTSLLAGLAQGRLAAESAYEDTANARGVQYRDEARGEREWERGRAGEDLQAEMALENLGYTRGAQGRDETRTERGYQDALARQTMQDRITQREMEDRLTTSELQRRLALAQAQSGLAMDPALLQALMAYAGG